MKPTILFVDDRIEELEVLSDQITEGGNAVSEVVFPSDITNESLKNADLVIVDLTLDGWIDEEDFVCLGATPTNGIALASVLRQHSLGLRDAPPTGSP